MAAGVLGLVVILGLALDLNGQHFPLAGLFGCLLREIGVADDHGLLIGAAEQVGHHAVDGQIRVAADGAGEVGVILEHQTIVALGLFLIAGLGHAAEHSGVDDLLKRGAAHTFQNGAQLLGGGHFLGKVVIDAAGLQQAVQALQLLAVGLLVDTVDKGDLLDPGKVGGALVGQQHELLDHGLALAGGALFHIDAVAVLIQNELDFPALEIDAAALLAQAGTVGVQLLHGGQLIQHLGVLGLGLGIGSAGQQGVDLRIHALDPAADDGFDELVVGQIAVLIQTHQAGKRQAQLLLVQGADAVGKALGQHGHDLIRIVDRSGAVEGLLVQLTAGLDVVGDIGDVNAQLIATTGEPGQADGIVDILGLGAVDGEDGQCAQVHAALAVLLRHGHVLELLGLVPHLLGEAGVDVLGIEQGLGAALGFLAAAKAHGNAHAVILLPGPALQDLHSHLVAVLRAALAVALDGHGDGRAVIGHELQAALDTADSAHHVVLLLEHGKDLALIAALHPGVGKLLHQNGIAGHGTAGEAARDEDIAGFILQHHKGKVLAQLDHLAGQGLFGTAGAGSEEHAGLLADHSVVHQLVQSLHHLAVRRTVAAELCLEVLDHAGLVLDGMFDFIA